ncbi:hypothetical protein FACS1894187_05720 [Synergistales bacterium]|nr:hypothetical protein FACS1894187_05720 [Synergistales bacterium]
MNSSDFFDLCAVGTTDEIKLAIDSGADINAEDNRQRTPLMSAIANNANTEVPILLIASGADPNAKDKDGYTVLMVAAVNNPNPETTSLILNSSGADVNTKDTHGMTALMYAALSNVNPEVISLLLDSGADPYIKNKYGKQAIDYIKKNKDLRNTQVVTRLQLSSSTTSLER